VQLLDLQRHANDLRKMHGYGGGRVSLLDQQIADGYLRRRRR
jgi:hypothetical protein